MFAVTPGPFAVLDIDGNALCHSPRQSKRALNSRVRNDVKGLHRAALVAAGLSDGVTALCANDGVSWPFGAGEDDRDGKADFGHIIADSNDGAYCGCNAVPVEGSANRDNGDARQDISGWSDSQSKAYGEAFRTLAIARMTKTKRARVA